MNQRSYEWKSKFDRIDKYLTNALRLHSGDTFDHSERVERYCNEIICCSGLNVYSPMNEPQKYIVKEVARLHDIGKIIIPSSWIDNDGPLNPFQHAWIKTHSFVGYLIVISFGYMLSRDLNFMNDMVLPIARGVLYSHETYEGKGYPRRLKGEEIPIEARIVRVADDYDASVTRKNMLDRTKALEGLKSASGTRLDPRIVQLVFDNDLFTT
ncbi:MAG: HD domain-containing protein [Candidatus Aenigmarchaeota archaeon]|nr:HD domain-containing protein [Candidatus Aenigmarchaeota archaeon]